MLSLAGLGLLGISAAHGQAVSSSWPTKAVKIIVPYPAGGVTDAAARLLADHLVAVLGRPVVIDNRAGAGGITGMEALAKADDDHTVGFGPVSPITLLPHLRRVPYDAQRDFVPVASVMYSPVYRKRGPKAPLTRAAC
ncbi:tripartite tricarboxylate transporter substrate-binding protein [Paucibacter sp. O1-1]|nr:tripartite tricarboxylate transporter substrate-binding protein [Paucibacter sp. O1-1]MDA3825055.1 tripartite tricarboxylate transporter substrate-binding protein [Paucibacter sp. O1-1]